MWSAGVKNSKCNHPFFPRLLACSVSMIIAQPLLIGQMILLDQVSLFCMTFGDCSLFCTKISVNCPCSSDALELLKSWADCSFSFSVYALFIFFPFLYCSFLRFCTVFIFLCLFCLDSTPFIVEKQLTFCQKRKQKEMSLINEPCSYLIWLHVMWLLSHLAISKLFLWQS